MNKLSYDDAVSQLKVLEKRQRGYKRNKAVYSHSKRMVGECQYSIDRNKKYINLLLSVINAHKTARKLYSKNKKLTLLADESTDIKSVIAEIHNVQKNEPSSRTDDYMRGMYNGFEVIRAAVTDHNLNLIDSNGKFDNE